MLKLPKKYKHQDLTAPYLTYLSDFVVVTKQLTEAWKPNDRGINILKHERHARTKQQALGHLQGSEWTLAGWRGECSRPPESWESSHTITSPLHCEFTSGLTPAGKTYSFLAIILISHLLLFLQCFSLVDECVYGVCLCKREHKKTEFWQGWLHWFPTWALHR